MAELIESRHTGEFVLSLANFHRSIDNGVLALGQNLKAGTVLGVSGAGKYSVLDPAGTDGTEAAAAILLGNVDATDAEQACALVVRDAEVIGAALTWPDGISAPDKAAAIAALAVDHVIVR